MARGQAAKQQVMAMILEQFPGSFMYNGNKEIRVPMAEDGAEVQIKITLTAAKENVSPDGENALPGATPAKETIKVPVPDGTVPFDNAVEIIEPSAEEKEAVSTLMAQLGL